MSAWKPQTYGTPDPVTTSTAPRPSGFPTVTPDQVATGGLLTCNPGTWDGSATISFAYQWLRNGAAIGGATSATYTRQVADEGNELACRVTASNSVGSFAAIAGVASRPLPFNFSGLAPAIITGSGQAQARGARADLLPSYGWTGHFSARDPLAYVDRVFPSNGADVNFLRARSGLLSHLMPRADRANPTFALNADGAARAGLRFTAGDGEALEWPGIAPLQSADAQWTMWAAFRTAATPGGRQTIMHINRDGAANAFRECVRLDITATQFIVISGTNGSATDDTNSAIISQVPASGETYIMVGRHGTSGGGDHQNKIDLRKGGATTTVTSANSLTLNFASTAALQQGIVGGYRRGGWSQHFDGWLFDGGYLPFRLSDTDTAALIDAVRLELGVA